MFTDSSENSIFKHMIALAYNWPAEGLERSIIVVGGKSFIEPNISPPLRSHQVSVPLNMQKSHRQIL